MKLLRILNALEENHWSFIHKIIKVRFRTTSLEYKTWILLYNMRHQLNSWSVDQLRQLIGHTGSTSSYRNVLSRLCNRIEESIVLHELKYTTKGQERYKMMLASFFKRRGILSLYNEHMTSLKVHEPDMMSYDPMQYLYQVEHHYDYIYSENTYENKSESYDTLLKSAAVLSQYVHVLLKLESDNRNSLYNKASTTDEKISNSANDPLLEMLALAHQVVTYGPPASYQQLLQIITDQHNMIPPHLVQMMLIYLNNYCYHHIRQGQEDYYHQLLIINNFGIDSGYLLSQGLLSERRFINMIELKSYFDSDDNVVSYINRWYQKINTSDVDSLIDMAHAWRFFGRDDYRKCIASLQNITISKERYWLQLMRKWLYLCCLSTFENHKYYDKELITTEKYLDRNKRTIRKRLHLGSMNLIRILRMKHRGVAMEMIASEISNMDSLVMRYWLNNQIRKGHADH